MQVRVKETVQYVMVAGIWEIKTALVQKNTNRLMNTETEIIRALLWFPFWTILVKALLKEQNEPHKGDNILWYFILAYLAVSNPFCSPFCIFTSGLFFKLSNYPSLALTATFTKSINISPKRFIVTGNNWSNFPLIRGIIWPSTLTNSVKTTLPVAKKPGG